MNESILLLTAGIELGLVVGYCNRWLADCRAMYLHFCGALRGGK